MLTLDKLNRSQIVKAMSETTQWGNGIKLVPSRQLQSHNNWHNMDYDVRGSQIPVSAYAQTVVGNYGYSLIMLAIDEASSMTDAKKTIDAISRSVKWQPVKTQKPVARKNRQLTQYMSGRKLTRFYTGSGYREKEIFYFCNDGRFTRYFESGGFGGGVSMASQDNDQGTWLVSGTQQNGELILNYDDSKTGSYTLEVKDDGIYLNDSKFLRVGSADC